MFGTGLLQDLGSYYRKYCLAQNIMIYAIPCILVCNKVFRKKLLLIESLLVRLVCASSINNSLDLQYYSAVKPWLPWSVKKLLFWVLNCIEWLLNECCLPLTVRRDVQENDEEAVRVKEQSILELGTLLAKTGQAAGKQVLMFSSKSYKPESVCIHAKIYVSFCLQNWGVCWNLWGLSWFPSARPRRPGWFALCWTSFLTWRQQQGRKLSCVLNALSGPRLRREPSYDKLWRWGGHNKLVAAIK